MLAQLLGSGSAPQRQATRYATVDAAASWLDDVGLLGARSHQTFVPTDVFHLPKPQIALFVRHLWGAAGSVSVTPDGRSGRLSFPSTSRRLADDIARLLLRFGISSRLRTAGSRESVALDITGVDDQRRFLQEIGVHGAAGANADRLLAVVRALTGASDVDTLPRRVWDDVRDALVDQSGADGSHGAASPSSAPAPGFPANTRQRLGMVAEVLDRVDLDVLAVNDLLWDEVVAIEPLGEQQVFDATVVGTHNFIANGIAVHNSIEQDADMVILLHREDAYEKESPRAGEADLIVAKHRNGPTDTITVAFQGHYSRFVDMQS
jgi:replicative DNA helicase